MYKSTFCLGLLASFVACFPVVVACGDTNHTERDRVIVVTPTPREDNHRRDRARHAPPPCTPTPVPVPRKALVHGVIVSPTCDSPYDDVCGSKRVVVRENPKVLYPCTCSRIFYPDFESKCLIDGERVIPGNTGGIATVFDSCWLK